MRTRRSARTAALAVLALALGLLLGPAHSALAQGTPDPDLPYLSEVAPTAGPGAPAWVEITMGRTNPGTVQQPFSHARVLLPLVGGGSAPAAAASSAGVAAFPDTGYNLHGWHLSDMDGNTYGIPLSLPFLSKGVVVLIRLDGLGPAADEMGPSDGRVTLHTPANFVSVLDAAGDQLALHNPSNTLIDFVAWGQPAGPDDDEAVAAGKWVPETFAIYDGGFGAGQVNVPPAPNASLGIWQDSLASNAQNWVGYAATGMIPPTAPSVHRFHVGDVPSLMIVANFDKTNAGEIQVFDPTGQPVNLLLPAVQKILDTTHDQVRIGDPMPGLWRVEVKKRTGVTLPVEYTLFASADTPLTLNLVAGAPIPIPTTGAAAAIVPLAAFVADDALLTSGVGVTIDMRRPDGTVQALQVFDDGTHNDGAAGDGIWGANAPLVQRGPYSFKARATIQTPGATYRYAQIVVNY